MLIRSARAEAGSWPEAKATLMQRPKVSTTIATIAGIFAILVIIVAVIWYFASLENRVRTREDHVGYLDCRADRGGSAKGDRTRTLTPIGDRLAVTPVGGSCGRSVQVGSGHELVLSTPLSFG